MTGLYSDWITFSKAVAVVGICKNAGKTTLLNQIIESNPGHRWGVMSTGIDGEETDKVFGHRKPALRLPCGTIFVCDTPTVNTLGSSIAILQRVEHSGRRKLWIARAMEDIETSITGPANVREQTRCVTVLSRFGAQTVLIDGSFDRKSIAQSSIIDGVVLAVGAGFGTIDEIIIELRRILSLTHIRLCEVSPLTREQMSESPEVRVSRKGRWKTIGLESLIGDRQELEQALERFLPIERIYVPGAITDSVIDHLLSLKSKISEGIVVRHPDCIKLDTRKFSLLSENYRITTLNPLVIKGVSLNPWAPGTKQPDTLEFRSRIRAEFPDLDLVDIMEIK